MKEKKRNHLFLATVCLGIVPFIFILQIKEAYANEINISTHTENIKINSTGDLPITKNPRASFDYHTLFKDYDDLSGFNSVTVNTPVKIDTSENEDDTREYYMFFGGIGYQDTNASLRNNKGASTVSDLGKTITSVSASYPNILASSPDSTSKPISYGYNYDSAGYNNTAVGSGFSVAALADANVVDRTNNLFTNAGIDTAVSSFSKLDELWVDHVGHRIRGYGYVQWANKTRIPIKITGNPVDKHGRVRWTFEFANPDIYPRVFASAFGVHMDIQGKHTSSKMYSLGGSDGLYFKQDGSDGAPLLADKAPYYLYFYRGQQVYPGDANAPTIMYGNNNATSQIGMVPDLNAVEPDLPANVAYPYQVHPGWLFRWEDVVLKTNQVAKVDLDTAVTNKKKQMEKQKMTVMYVDENYNPIASEKYSDVYVGDKYDIGTPPVISGYTYSGYEGDPPSGTVEAGKDLYILLKYESNREKQKITTLYVDENYNPIASEKVSNGYVGDKYDIGTPPNFNGYTYSGNEGDPPSGVVKTGEDIYILLRYDTKQFTLQQTVSQTEAQPETKLNYTIDLTSGMNTTNPETYYKDFTITGMVDTNLEGITNVKLTKEDGSEVGIAVYNSAANTVTGKVTAKDTIPSSENLKLVYEGTIKKATAVDTVLVGKAKASGTYSKEPSQATEKVANDVSTKIENTDVTVNVQFLDENDSLVSKYSTSFTGNLGSEIDLSSREEVMEKIAEVQNDGYEIDERPTNEQSFPLNQQTVTAIYKLQGIVRLDSIPKTIDFGTIEFDGKAKRVDAPNYTERLVVSDTRANKTSSWTLYSKIQKEMTNSQDETKKLYNVLRYVDKGNELTLSSSALPVYQDTSGLNGKTDVTNLWGTENGTDGLKLQFDGTGSPKLGDYTGEILWQVIVDQP